MEATFKCEICKAQPAIVIGQLICPRSYVEFIIIIIIIYFGGSFTSNVSKRTLVCDKSDLYR